MSIHEREYNAEEQEIRRLVQSIPILQDKMIVDLVNGIQVTQDHIRVSQDRITGLGSRIVDAVTGKSALRQQRIDQNLNEGLRSTMIWLENLQASQIQTDRALAYVTEKLSETRQGIMKLVDKHVALKNEVRQLTEQMHGLEEQFTQQSEQIRNQLTSIDMRQSALIQMNQEFDKWAGGGYASFSPLLQMFLVLEALSWGPFGVYDAVNPEFREQLNYKCAVLLKDVRGIPMRNLPTDKWMLSLVKERAAHKEMLRFLLQDDAELLASLPLQSTMLKVVDLEEHSAESMRSILTQVNVPLVFESKRLSQRLLMESRIRLHRRGLHAS
ncbi:diguanylate cyclase regulator RdcB family protein [Paenibacillus lemnae]|uniref:Uncharacterized protein n=1 Tax=Paenibacillus lemnae TaxID=1330551 RepID=A0A848M1Z6_PAELE|nr:diguanylate cyclase regulator RdcB family protein [Paenibacillus lemnae]NMO94988.1 hypothetical protein [Paenibacillus lemnae]